MTKNYSLSLFFFVFALTIYGIFEWRTANKKDDENIDSNLTPDFIAEVLKSNTFDQAQEFLSISAIEYIIRINKSAFAIFQLYAIDYDHYNDKLNFI